MAGAGHVQWADGSGYRRGKVTNRILEIWGDILRELWVCVECDTMLVGVWKPFQVNWPGNDPGGRRWPVQ